MFTIVIFGSRHYKNQEDFDQACDRLLANKHPDIEIVEGDCQGPDQMAEAYAIKRGYAHTKFKPDWDGLGKRAGFVRNRAMADYVKEKLPDAGGIAFYDGVSKGTAMMIELMKDRGLKVKVVPVPLPPPKPVRNKKSVITYADLHAGAEAENFSISTPGSKSGDDLSFSWPITINNPIDFNDKTPLNKHRKPIVIEGEELIAKPKSKHKKKPQPSGDNAWKARYQAAHEEHFKRETPMAHKDGHYLDPIYPRVRESNGMQTAIVNYLNWKGHRAKRINNMGRQVDGVDTTESGAQITVKKWIQSAAGKGQADISATIHGRSCQLEVKAGNDKPSPGQLKEQAKERKAGGVYEFIHSIEQFFQWYDNFIPQRDLFGNNA